MVTACNIRSGHRCWPGSRSIFFGSFRYGRRCRLISSCVISTRRSRSDFSFYLRLSAINRTDGGTMRRHSYTRLRKSFGTMMHRSSYRLRSNSYRSSRNR